MKSDNPNPYLQFPQVTLHLAPSYYNTALEIICQIIIRLNELEWQLEDNCEHNSALYRYLFTATIRHCNTDRRGHAVA
jgi:hypothetical protein